MITSDGIKCDVCGKWATLPIFGLGELISFTMKDPETGKVQGQFEGHDDCVELIKQACLTPENWRNFPEGPLKEAYKEANESLHAGKARALLS